ncbi:MAG: hypothetical protein U0836_02800 [Pirellulales bacterium]
MTDASQPRRRLWQFSVRETLLLTVIAALAAAHIARVWFQESHSLSPFYERADLLAWTEQIARTHVFSMRSGSGGGSESRQIYGVRRYQLALEPAGGAPTRAQFVAELQRMAGKALADSKCTDLGTATSGEPVDGFSIDYTWRQNRGSLDVQSYPLPNGGYGVFFTLHEARVER